LLAIRRNRDIESGSTHRSAWSSDRVGNNAGDLTHRYLHGPVIDQILADEEVTSLTQAGTMRWPLADNLGTVRDLVDSSATVLNHLMYDAYGKVTNESNAAVEFLFAFTGRERDEETGLRFNRAR
jgi:hypothetical protein